MGYPHKNIWVNGRNVSYGDIVEDRIVPRSKMEESTFNFIRAWEKGATKFVIPTSGSTGAPKKLVVSRDQMIQSAKRSQQALGFSTNENALLCLDTEYIAGKMMVVRSLVFELQLYVVDPCSNPLIKIPLDRSIHFTALVPYQIKSILESKHPHLLDTMKLCIIGGAPLDDVTYDRLKNFATSFYLTYGMTETLSHMALHRVSGDTKDKTFTALPGVKISTDKRGCLVVEADYLPEEITTNDVVEIFNTNQFLWKGRIDNVINSGGVKLFPEIIEEKIGHLFTRSGYAKRFFLHKVPDNRLGERAVLVVETQDVDRPILEKLLEELPHSISQYEIPKEVYVNSSFTFTATQKIHRQESFKSAHILIRG